MAPIDVALVLHTAVDLLPYQRGAGVGIIQRAESASASTVRHQCRINPIIRHRLFPDEHYKKTLTSLHLKKHKIKSLRSARIISLLHALNLVLATINKTEEHREAIDLQKVTVFTDSPAVARDVSRCIQHGPTSVLKIARMNERPLLRKVIASAEKVAHHGLAIIIATSYAKEKSESRDKAKVLARQTGRKAYARCRRRQVARARRAVRNKQSEEQDQNHFQLAIRTKEPTSERTLVEDARGYIDMAMQR